MLVGAKIRLQRNLRLHRFLDNPIAASPDQNAPGRIVKPSYSIVLLRFHGCARPSHQLLPSHALLHSIRGTIGVGASSCESVICNLFLPRFHYVGRPVVQRYICRSSWTGPVHCADLLPLTGLA